jgi:ubiquitin C-terminal hydrolase
MSVSGLANLGNTCFMNSCLQVLSHVKELDPIFDSPTFRKKQKICNESALLNEWNDLRKQMVQNKTGAPVVPKRFVSCVQGLARIKKMDLFTGFAQNDVSEFLLFLVDCFHTSLARQTKMTIRGNTVNRTDELAIKCYKMIQRMYSKEYSEIWTTFYAVHVSEIRCSTGLEQTPEPFFMLDLPIPPDRPETTLRQCFDLYTQPESIDGWRNEKTGHSETVQKRIAFWSLPDVLVIDLKRFNASVQKRQTLVTFPLTDLDLSSYVVGYNANAYVYELFGVCNHSGGVFGGHYTAFAKSSKSGQWRHFNDTSVSNVSEATVISTKAYCLFYRKKTKQ